MEIIIRLWNAGNALRGRAEALEQQFAARSLLLQKTEEQLRQAQKMEAVGQLTGGLAHDFNNILTAIKGSIELLRRRIGQRRFEDLDRYLSAAEEASDRAAAVTNRLLAFSRRQTLDPKLTDINRLIADMEALIARTVGPAIAVTVLAPAASATALIDPNQLESALLNLCINAKDALPDGGRITIGTAIQWLDSEAARGLELPPGPYILLSVRDNGCGMPAEIVERAFDPFFTTKPLGQGTGLGLSMTYGFARQSGGNVRIVSEPNLGTAVMIYLPRADRHSDSAAAISPDEAAPATAPCGDASLQKSETVLVVDDEPHVRMLVAETLDDRGYQILQAGEGISALKILRSNVPINLLITDVGLPGAMNGRQLADAARAIRPGLSVIFITGYAENVLASKGQLETGMQVLTKPFSMDVLASRVQHLINVS
jgi:signal transduction histidine kinase/CheY-like chemotaxis protein